ncbi:hypothetical protein [Sporosarcina beigongshangi]|uniref:hypothetical protein n=1 Tax=Sporosarcina beigongshangi TaxID=2782538 RepID=UPI00193A85BE|nr:hypothetical protein [Sporosarcina beigongshangi]
MNVSIELQKAIYQQLALGSYDVTEIKQTSPVFPFIEIGQEIQRDVNVKSHNRTFHHVTIHTFSKGSDSSVSKVMNQFVKDSILNLKQVDSFQVDFVRLDNLLTLTETEIDTTIWHGILQFEIELTGRKI